MYSIPLAPLPLFEAPPKVFPVIDTPWLFCTLIPSRVLDWTVKFWTPMLLLRRPGCRSACCC